MLRPQLVLAVHTITWIVKNVCFDGRLVLGRLAQALKYCG